MAVVASATGAAVFGLSGVAAGLAGGALLGAGIGGVYSAVTGDGNVLNSMLTGGLLGAGAGGLGAALAPAAGGSVVGGGAAGMKVGTVGTSSVGMSPALKTVAGSSASTATGLTAPTLPSLSTFGTLGGAGAKTAALTGGQKLAAGLAGTTALSMLGGQNQPTIQQPSQSESYIRPYTYSQKRNPRYGEPGESYFTQSYTAGEPYEAASGGIMRMAEGGKTTIADLYQQNLQRPADAEGMQYWRNSFGTNTPNAAQQQEFQVAAAPEQLNRFNQRSTSGGMIPLAAQSSQYGPAAGSNQAQVAGMYRNILGRASDAAGAQFHENQMAQGRDVNAVRNDFRNSPENQAREAQRGQVNAYNQLIAERANNEYNVQPPPLSTLPGRGQFASAPDVSKIINRYYQQNLGRTADPEGLAFHTSQVTDRGVGLGDIAQNIRTSPEGLARQQQLQQQTAQAQQAPTQTALENNPAYTAYMSSPITRENFDGAAYLAANPDVARAGRDPFAHYQEFGRNENRVVTRLPFIPSTQTASPSQGGFTYDPVTKRFTSPTLAPAGGASAQDNSFMGMDPNVLQQMYNQYVNQQQYSGGGKSGGLMPNNLRYANGGNVQGYNLGGYSDGGRLLKGPGDGVSDDIPAVIGDRQPARLADNEFVIPARIVSEIGNGSTDAGARRLYAMMDRVQNSRKKSIGKNKVAVNSKAYKELDKL